MNITMWISGFIDHKNHMKANPRATTTASILIQVMLIVNKQNVTITIRKINSKYTSPNRLSDTEYYYGV